MFGVKADVGRTLIGVVDRGLRGRVMRFLVDRVCFDLAPHCVMIPGVRPELGGRHVLEKNGERGEYFGA